MRQVDPMEFTLKSALGATVPDVKSICHDSVATNLPVSGATLSVSVRRAK